MGPNPGACRRRSTGRSLSARCAFGCSVTAILSRSLLASRMLHYKERTAQPHSWHISRHQETKEYACIGNFWTTALRGDGAENGHSSGPIASRDDGAVSSTAAKTFQGSVRREVLLTLGSGFLLRTQDMILFQHLVRRDEQTERVCVPYTLPRYRFVARQTRFARENMVTPAPTPRHARTRPRADARPKTTTTALCWDFLKKAYLFNFSKKNFLEVKGATPKTTKKS